MKSWFLPPIDMGVLDAMADSECAVGVWVNVSMAKSHGCQSKLNSQATCRSEQWLHTCVVGYTCIQAESGKHNTGLCPSNQGTSKL